MKSKLPIDIENLRAITTGYASHVLNLIRTAADLAELVRVIAQAHDGLTQAQVIQALTSPNRVAPQVSVNQGFETCVVIFKAPVQRGRVKQFYIYIPHTALVDQVSFTRWIGGHVREQDAEYLASFVDHELRARKHGRAMMRLSESQRADVIKKANRAESRAAKVTGGVS